MPGFVASLRLLADEERYSVTDIAMMFGVSRERMRQLCGKHGVVTSRGRGLYSVRMWDDATNRFRAVKRGTIRANAKAARMADRSRGRADNRIRHRGEIIGAIRSLVSTLGRVPTSAEVARVFWPGVSNGSVGPRLAQKWHGRLEGVGSYSYRGISRAMYAAAGVEPRGRGGAGHIKEVAA